MGLGGLLMVPGRCSTHAIHTVNVRLVLDDFECSGIYPDLADETRAIEILSREPSDSQYSDEAETDDLGFISATDPDVSGFWVYLYSGVEFEH